MSDYANAEHEAGNASESPPEEEQQCLQKQKLDEEDDNQQLLEGEQQCPPGEEPIYYDSEADELAEEEWERYSKQVKDSEGFDVDEIPNKWPFGLIVPVLDLDVNEWMRQNVTVCSFLAIETYNNENDATYEFVKVVKVNLQIVSGYMLFITFEAKDTTTADTEIFQALVHNGISENIVKFCRCKTQLGSSSVLRTCLC